MKSTPQAQWFLGQFQTFNYIKKNRKSIFIAEETLHWFMRLNHTNLVNRCHWFYTATNIPFECISFHSFSNHFLRHNSTIQIQTLFFLLLCTFLTVVVAVIIQLAKKLATNMNQVPTEKNTHTINSDLCLIVLTHPMGFATSTKKKIVQTEAPIKSSANIDTVQIFGEKI